MAYIINTDGTRTEVKPQNGTHFELEEMQNIVGGYIDIITFNEKCFVANDEGLIMNLPYNAEATTEAINLFDSDYNTKLTRREYGLVGNILVTEKEFIR